MEKSRSYKAKLNILTALICQVVTLVCGLVVPRFLIKAFGSEAYGAAASISQFIGFISFLEGGIGAVARAALYKPLAEHNIEALQAVTSEINLFFRKIAYIFGVYTFVLAVSYKFLSGIQVFDWISTFLLVIVISLSTFAQYFIGITYQIVLQANQKLYIVQLTSIFAIVLNAVLSILLINLGASLIIVKFVSSSVFIFKPIVLWLYFRMHYSIKVLHNNSSNYLEQKWTGLGQHIAYIIHNNTDIAVLTLVADLKNVAVYSVYYMVVSHIQSLTASFVSGMEAVYGDMLAKKETAKLSKTFGYYETMISAISVFLYSITATMIVPFVQLYTKGITDTNYIQPLFGFILTISSLVYCLRLPYHALIMASGQLRETRIGAFGEAIINIVLSVLFVASFGLIGVAIGTLVSVSFRFFYYVFYVSKHIIERSCWLFIKRVFCDLLSFATIYIIGLLCIAHINICSYFQWLVISVIVSVAALIIVGLINLVFYSEDVKSILSKVLKKK